MTNDQSHEGRILRIADYQPDDPDDRAKLELERATRELIALIRTKYREHHQLIFQEEHFRLGVPTTFQQLNFQFTRELENSTIGFLLREPEAENRFRQGLSPDVRMALETIPGVYHVYRLQPYGEFDLAISMFDRKGNYEVVADVGPQFVSYLQLDHLSDVLHSAEFTAPLPRPGESD